VKIQELLARPIHPLQSNYPIIANNYFSFILVEHYFSPFWQKEIKKMLSLYYVKGSKTRENAKSFLLLKFHTLFFSLQK